MNAMILKGGKNLIRYTAIDICLRTVTRYLYENEVALREQEIPLKCCQPLDFLYASLKGLHLLILQIKGL